MSYTPQQAYDAIKNLEQQTTFPLPLSTATIDVGIFDAATSSFGYSVPTETQTYTIPSRIGPNGKPTGPMTMSILVAVIPVYAVNLILRFTVKNPKHNFKVEMGPYVQSINTDQMVAVADAKLSSSTKAASKVKATKIKVKPFPGGPINVGPFAPRSVSLNVGVWSPPPTDGAHPPGVQVTMWSGAATTQIQLVIARPPIFEVGAFTMPALPLSIIYAPPPGAQGKDFAEYTKSVSVSRKISTSTSSSNGKKVADAYAPSDFVGKISSTVGSLKGWITSGLKEGAVLTYVNMYGAFLDLSLNLLSSTLDDITTNTTTTGTTGTEHDEITTEINLSTFGSAAGLGPGLGDRFVYLRNVKVAYMITNGQLSLTVIGSDGIREFAAQQLINDLAAIQASSGAMRTGPTTNLDADTLQSLISLDPFIGNPAPTLSEPRFVQNDPPSAGGNGTGPNGDSFSVTHDFTTVDISTASEVTTTVTDFKPGWMNALFDGAQASETTVTNSYSYTAQTTVDNQQTATVHFFAGTNDPPYLVGLYFDRLFGTFAFTPWSGQLLKKKSKPVKPAPKKKVVVKAKKSRKK
jgi:hypothetical protein